MRDRLAKPHDRGGGIGHFDLGRWWVDEFNEEERS